MKKLHEISILIDVYGKVISEKQLSCISLFYFNDLSLQEIADIQKITRAAVYNNINKAVNELFSLEEKLQLISKNQEREKIYSQINDPELVIKLKKIEGK